MIFYELLVLLKPDISQDVYDQLQESIEHIVNNDGGEIKTFDRWGKYLLAYPVQKLSYGIYSLVRFGVAKDINKERLFGKLRSLFTLKFNASVMRHVFVKQGKELSATYFRPDLLTDTPRRERSEFSGNNKAYYNSEATNEDGIDDKKVVDVIEG